MKRGAFWRSLLLLSLSFLLLTLSVYGSLAWLSGKHPSALLGLGAGSLPENTLHVALLTRIDPDTPPTEDMRTYQPCEGGRFLADHYPTAAGDTYTVELSDLSLGIIDNVVLVKPENRVFLRLTVPKESGDTVDVKLYYGAYEDGYFAELYKNVYADDGETVLGQAKVTASDTLPTGENILESFHAVEGEDMANDCYLSFSLLVSNEEIAASELAARDFYGADGQPAGEGTGSFYRVNDYTAASEGITVRNENIGEAGDFYYVYVCIEPNLAVFGYSIEYISGIMPCYLFFKLNAAFTVYGG